VADRVDPARTGVKAGRVVGLLTAGLAVVSLLSVRETYYANVSVLLDAIGVGVPVAWLFWTNAAGAAAARYGIGYVAGSLVGVGYDWLGRPTPWAVVPVVGVIGVVDGALAFLDTGSVPIAAGYLLAWLAYAPVFAWLFGRGGGDGEGGESEGGGEYRRTGAKRLG